jgi:hypothetical protein
MLKRRRPDQSAAVPASLRSCDPANLDALFKRIGELNNAGVRGVSYCTLMDNPSFDTSNYHGIAERYWGLLRADGSEKPAFSRLVEGVRAENGGRTSAAMNAGGTK